MCVCECVPSARVNQIAGALNAKIVKATDFKFDTHVSRDSPDKIH